MQGFHQEVNSLVWKQDNETVRIDPWGPDSLRVRATMGTKILDALPGALLQPAPSEVYVESDTKRALIRNGTLIAEIRQEQDAVRPSRPTIRFLKATTGDELLAEAGSYFPRPAARYYKPAGGDHFGHSRDNV